MCGCGGIRCADVVHNCPYVGGGCLSVLVLALSDVTVVSFVQVCVICSGMHEHSTNDKGEPRCGVPL